MKKKQMKNVGIFKSKILSRSSPDNVSMIDMEFENIYVCNQKNNQKTARKGREKE